MAFGLGKKKNEEEFSETLDSPMMGGDDMLDQLEAETSGLGLPPPPPKPASMGGTPLPPPPEGHPAPEQFDMPSGSPVEGEEPAETPEEKPAERTEKALTKHQVAKLPLFMRVEEYDKIVGELTVLVQSLKNMEDIMNEQLTRTKDQVRSLLSEMPETGELKDALKEKVKIKKRAQVREDVEKLKKLIAILQTLDLSE